MKRSKFTFLCLIVGCAHVSAQAQGFVNLDFESATLVPVSGDPYGAVQFSKAFPGWAESSGTFDVNALSNNIFLDSSGISIINSGFKNGLTAGGVIQGNYTAILQAGYGSSGMPTDMSLSQTGLVPLGTQSLQFEAFQAVDGASAIIPFGVMLGGQDLSLTVISNTLNYTLYGADVSAWAGQTAQLSFTVFTENPHLDNQYLYLDAIQFSSSPVPEPSELAFAALGAFLFGFRCWRQPLQP